MFRAVTFFLFCPLLILCSCEKEKPENGSGRVVTEGVEVDQFDRIEFSASGKLIIEQGEASALQIEADDNLQPLVSSKVRGGTLILEIPSEGSSPIQPTKPVVYHVTINELKKLIQRGEGEIASQGKLIGEYLILEVSGKGSTALDINVEDLTLDLSEGGEVKLTGLAEKQDITIKDTGFYQAGELLSQEAAVKIAGKGKATINTTDTLDVAIAGEGTVDYLGTPKTNIKITGNGKVNRVGKTAAP